MKKFLFADGPENYFWQEFNFANCPYFPRNCGNFVPANISSNKVAFLDKYIVINRHGTGVFIFQTKRTKRSLSFSNIINVQYNIHNVYNTIRVRVQFQTRLFKFTINIFTVSFFDHLELLFRQGHFILFDFVDVNKTTLVSVHIVRSIAFFK